MKPLSKKMERLVKRAHEEGFGRGRDEGFKIGDDHGREYERNFGGVAAKLAKLPPKGTNMSGMHVEMQERTYRLIDPWKYWLMWLACISHAAWLAERFI